MKYKCNHDCFNCIFSDCIVDEISSEERAEIKERDKQYFTPVEAARVIRQKPSRVKNRGRVMVIA